MINKCTIAFLILSLFIPLLNHPQAQKPQVQVTSKIPEFPAHLPWLNVQEPLSIEKLKGHVYMLVFLSYSNIHSLRVLPELEEIQEEFKDHPFQLIGIHSAKFYSEMDEESVKLALHRYGIRFPVIVDKDHVLWKRFRTQGWPTYVLVDAGGNGVMVLSGEKRKKSLIRNIKTALKNGKKDQILASQKLTITVPPIPKTQLAFPTKILFNEQKKQMIIVDSGHHQIVEAQLLSPLKAKILQRIGSGERKLKNGDFSTASFFNPWGIHRHDQILYVADTLNHAVRAIDLDKKTVTTLSGDGEYGPFGKPNAPWDIVYYEGILYITMTGSHQIWTYDLEENQLDLLAGNGYENAIDGSAMGSCMSQPAGISVDQEGQRLFFMDSGSSSLRVQTMEDGHIKTLIGHGLFKYGFTDGPLEKASLQNPLGLQFVKGKIYIADTYNHALRVVDLEKSELSTLICRGGNNADDKKICFIGGKNENLMPLYEPNNVRFYQNRLYICDTDNHLIRVYDIEAKKLETLTLEE